MTRHHITRRDMLMGTAALGALAAGPDRLLAQQPARSSAAPAAQLPPRDAFVIRGATVLTMDPAIADLATGDVHVADGRIAAVAARVDAGNARVIDGAGMICMPGFVDSHWHLWTSLFRPFVRADVAEVGYFPVSNRLGQLMTPEDSYRAVILGTAEAL